MQLLLRSLTFLSVACLTSVLTAQNPPAMTPEQLVAQTLERDMKGFTFNKRLATDDTRDTVMLFERGESIVIIAWTEGPDKVIIIPATAMLFDIYGADGSLLAQAQAQRGALTAPLTQLPRYFVPTQINPILRIGAAASRLARTQEVRGPEVVPVGVTFTNVLPVDYLLSLNSGERYLSMRPGESQQIINDVLMGRQDQPMNVLVGASGFMQETQLLATNPVTVSLMPDLSGSLNLTLKNPSGEPFRARAELRLITAEVLDPLAFSISMTAGKTFQTYNIPLATNDPIPFPMQLVLIDSIKSDNGEKRPLVLAQSPVTFFRPAGSFRGIDEEGRPAAYQVMVSKGSIAALTSGSPEEGLPNVDTGCLEMIFDLKQSGAVATVVPRSDALRQIQGFPAALGIWVHSDGSGLGTSMTLRDGTGQRHVFAGPNLDWTSWRYVRFDLDPNLPGPISIETFFQVNGGDYPAFGKVYLNDATWIYEEFRQAQVNQTLVD
ncbi:MAG: hypothetical protein AAGA45_01460 [Verrucomicrobiota bacterium]